MKYIKIYEEWNYVRFKKNDTEGVAKMEKGSEKESLMIDYFLDNDWEFDSIDKTEYDRESDDELDI